MSNHAMAILPNAAQDLLTNPPHTFTQRFPSGFLLSLLSLLQLLGLTSKVRVLLLLRPRLSSWRLLETRRRAPDSSAERSWCDDLFFVFFCGVGFLVLEGSGNEDTFLPATYMYICIYVCISI